MFELYLDIQKQKVLEEFSHDEVKGRWKRFVGKWCVLHLSTFDQLNSAKIVRYKGLTFVRNRGELAEGWYDPATLQKAQASATSNAANAESRSRPRDSPRGANDSSDEDVVGPAMPGGEVRVYKGDKRAGPAIPNLQDLELQRGTDFGDMVC